MRWKERRVLGNASAPGHRFDEPRRVIPGRVARQQRPLAFGPALHRIAKRQQDNKPQYTAGAR
jgi:hypothetical protein